VNERIEKISEQAGNHADTYDDANGPIWFQMYNEKFAELIVRECIDICNDTNDASYLNGVIAGRKIKQHFGVEE
jgi:hypothetical protein